jgi:diacylglycerol kinase family enzyme
MKLVVLLNETAGTFAGRTPEIRRAFGAVRLAPEIATVGPGMLGAAVAAARDGGADAVIVGGGDGSLSTAAAELAGSSCGLGVLPLGTFNHFAKDLGIPLDLVGAARIVAEAHMAPLDIAEVNGRVFINHSALGIYPRMVRHRDLQRARFGRSKWLAMAVATVAALRDYPTFGLRIRVAGEAIARRTPFVFIGNNGYLLDAYGIGVGGGRDKLALLVAHDAGRLALVRMGMRAFSGRSALGGDLDALTFTSAFIDSRRRALRVEIDGEVAMLEPPLRYRLRPGALSVLQPRRPAELSPVVSVGIGGGRKSWIGTASAAAGNASRVVCASVSAS